MFNRRYILLMLGSMVIIIVAFIFLTRELNWNYVSDLYKDKDEPAAIIVDQEKVIETEQLHIFVSLDEEQFERLDQLRILIEDSNPNIEVTLTNQYAEQYDYDEWELKSKLDELGDVQLVPNEWILPLATKGLLQPVDRLMNSDSLASHLPGYTDALRWNGYLWGVPYSSNPYIILSHKLLQEFVDEAVENPIDDAVDVTKEPIEEIIHNNIPEIVNEVEVATSSNWDHMLEMLAKVERNDTEIDLLNIADNSYNSMLVWLTYGDLARQSGISNRELSEEQLTIVQWLAEHEHKIQLDNAIEEPNVEKENWPLYYMTSWEEFMSSEEELFEQYDSNELLIPVPWLNGYSFVIQANSKQAVAAIEWIEHVTQLASTNAQNYKEAPTRNMEYTLSSSAVVNNIGNLLNQKLTESQLMNVSPNWPAEYLSVKQQWDQASLLSDKLKLLQ
ncbi:extracellular solute-binding protein [Paenibacillus endoradicis]|uniref:extracellular solute-binding protein n=1 Tax=Paenibacillus endoradicis TaxID=2972487 RepID=UPI002158AEF4|nr:extracellular solute-binding protein [Paenibacillus endoradicis]MCR8655984.1 extracellular solute-binding protein [Paenibacillus endoradicis]MCR8658310.1 extracellular solute-binding protein [Paenibacillus endoradicis]